jgi:chromosome segregation ATPase
MKDLEFEFGSTMKRNLEEEIRNLRGQNQSRQENIIRLEAEELELRSRISHYERVRATHSSDMEELSSRIKDLEASKFEMIRKVETSFRDVKKKEKEAKELAESARELKDQILKLEGEMVLSEKLIKEKDSVIENLEDQLLVANSRLGYLTEEHDTLRTRQRNETDLFYRESDELRKKLLEYEHLGQEKKEFHEKFSAEIAKIENEMIQQLKEEKEFLQSELAAALGQLGTVPSFEKKGETPSKKVRASEGIDYIQKRLFEFNSKIDDIIVKNREISSREFGSNR